MSKHVTFNAQSRQITGKKVKQLRNQGLIPANIHGAVETTVPLTLENIPFRDLFAQVGETGLIYMTVGDEKTARPVLVDEVSRHPVTNVVTHVTFKQVNLKEKISAEVPVEYIGETANVPDSVVVQLVDSIEVEALPTDFPEKFEVDLSALQAIGDSITLGQLKFDSSKIKLVEEDLEKPLVILKEHVEEVEEVEVPVDVAAGAGEAGAEEKTEDQSAEAAA
jgi:large subunit ribosomal protein L25